MKHYLACCSRDAVGRETELYLKIASEEFVAKGLMVLERNWLDIYQPWERWSTGQGELPRVAVGSRIIPTSLIMKDGQTNPPQLISEVELIALMDRNGIGKPDCCYVSVRDMLDSRCPHFPLPSLRNRCYHRSTHYNYLRSALRRKGCQPALSSYEAWYRFG